MRIATTSCTDPIADPQQLVWDAIRGHSPEGLLLLGDNMYMDFGLLGPRRNGWPLKKALSDAVFAETMYNNYARQWEVQSFQKLVRSVRYVHTVWDDHDFAYNNSAGEDLAGLGHPNWRHITSALHQQFREVLRSAAGGASSLPYPPMPPLPRLQDAINQKIDAVEMWGKVRIVVLDGRFHRRAKVRKFFRGVVDPGQILSPDQQAQLSALYVAPHPLTLICTGSTLLKAPESWENFPDGVWLNAQNFPRTIFVTGDIHECEVRGPKTESRYHEITSSGAARPGPFGGSGNFAILDTRPDGVDVQLFEKTMAKGGVVSMNV